LKREGCSMLIAGRRYACPAYRRAQGECRPGKAQPPAGIEAGTVLDAHCRAALRLPGLGGYGAARRPGKAQPPPGIETGRGLDACCRAALRLPGLQECAGRM
ncbi:hypothetical protein, partial [Klebsiella quasipneumoniae]